MLLGSPGLAERIATGSSVQGVTTADQKQECEIQVVLTRACSAGTLTPPPGSASAISGASFGSHPPPPAGPSFPGRGFSRPRTVGTALRNVRPEVGGAQEKVLSSCGRRSAWEELEKRFPAALFTEVLPSAARRAGRITSFLVSLDTQALRRAARPQCRSRCDMDAIFLSFSSFMPEGNRRGGGEEVPEDRSASARSWLYLRRLVRFSICQTRSVSASSVAGS